MADFLVVDLPHLLTPRTEMSRILPRVVFDSFLRAPAPGQGLAVHSVADITGSTAADRAHMIDALSIADPGLRILETRSDGVRAHVQYLLGAMPPEAQAIFRFATNHAMRMVWGHVERGATTLRLRVPDGADAAQVGARLKEFLVANRLTADVRVETTVGPGDLARLQHMEATLAQAQGRP